MPYPTSSSATALGNIYQAADGTFTETFVIPSSAPYTHMIGAAAPYNYPVGWQIIPPSGVSNVVTITGAAHPSWVAVASAPTAGQFVYDTSISPTGGTLTFSAADAGQSVTATWIGSTDVNKALMQALVTALRDINAAAPSGIVALSPAGPQTGAISVSGTVGVGKVLVPGQTGNIPANSTINQALGWFNVPAGTANGTTLTIANTLITANSGVLLTLQGAGVTDNIRTIKYINRTVGANFQVYVQTTDGAVTNGSMDVIYFIVN